MVPNNSIVFLLLVLCSVRLITIGGGGVEATVAVSKNGSDLECSTWFVPVMSSGESSYCGKDISGKVRCNNASHEIAILPGYCMSHDVDLNQTVLGGCLYTETYYVDPSLSQYGYIHPKLSSIRQLKLCYTGIGFEDCKALSELLANSKHAEVLDIGLNKLSPDSIQLIIDGLSHNTSLEELNMSDSNFSSENLLHLASVLRMNTRLKMLNIERCNIQSSDSVHLAKSLEENTTTQLQILVLWNNPMGSEGAVAFASMLATNKSLTKLDMCECSIQGEGAVCLAKALEKNSTVREFGISYNPIGLEGAIAFGSMLKKNRNLEILDFMGGSVGEM